jgi:hypothetical protein
MRVPEEHARITVTTDQCHLGEAQALLKEPADGLMSEVVKSKVPDTGPALQALPGKPEGRAPSGTAACGCLRTTSWGLWAGARKYVLTRFDFALPIRPWRTISRAHDPASMPPAKITISLSPVPSERRVSTDAEMAANVEHEASRP